MYTNRYRFNLWRCIAHMCIVVMVVAVTYTAIDFCRFPERYVTTWKYQLYIDMQNGNSDAIAYYNDTYTINGINLFE